MQTQLADQKWHLYWQSVVNTMAEGVFIVDTDGAIVYLNPAAERITGYSQSDVLGKPCSLFESETCLACRDQDGGHVCQLFEQGRVSNRRCTIRRKDGTVVHLLKNASVLLDEHGQVIGGVETITDVSELVDKDHKINVLRRELDQEYDFEGLIGTSRPMRKVFELLQSAAASTAPVVILGESGTGKELAAAAIHRRSARAKGPFIKVNCAALNETLLESELFGHEKGAFTGADQTRKGRFEAAHSGSLFLDEVGDMPAPVQVKLLRVLQEGEIERVGSHRPIPVDVRIITATNQDLEALKDQGRLRDDLYYRINVIPVSLPPLRQHPQDIPLLAQIFVERTAIRSGREISGFSPQAMELLMSYEWPGNVRELINVVEYGFVTCPQGLIEPRHLPPSLLQGRGGQSAPGPENSLNHGQQEMRRQIKEALEASGGHRTKAAQMLGISRVTLWKRMKRLGLNG
ncbi:MAG: sigma 54-interacting transcriptional regulator [Desulfarculaceae bacterium]|jgi:PAS domain S-box-containing protein